MRYAKLERIVKTYYDSLEEGKVLGRMCTACGHIEFPPYLACNECGNLDTEWVDLTNVRARITQVLPPLNVFPENEFQDAHDGFVAVCVKIDNADPYVTSMVHVGRNAYDKIHANMENIVVKPYIIQGADTKVVVWVDENYKEEPKKKAEAKTEAPKEEKMAPAAKAETAVEDDPIVKAVLAAAAEGYDVDASELSLATDIREDLSPQSMKMIVMLSSIEEALDITIDITEAGECNTIADFVNAVRGKLGIEGTVSADAAPAADQAPEAGAQGTGEVDEVTKVVIDAAAEAYDVDPSAITPDTDIREDLSPQSMKMIVMLSSIEEALDITIDITEAGELNTIAEFVAKVKEKM